MAPKFSKSAIFIFFIIETKIIFLFELTSKDIIFFLIESYFDIIIIGYLFICLQLSGYVELKYGKDYLTVSMLSIFLSPISLFSIITDKDTKDES